MERTYHQLFIRSLPFVSLDKKSNKLLLKTTENSFFSLSISNNEFLIR